MYDIPQSIKINNKEFAIRNKGDYRMVLDCFKALEDDTLSEQERLMASVIIFYADINCVEDIKKLPSYDTAITEMFNFFNCGQTESPGMKVNYKLIDWEQDSQLVCSAINKVANKEIRAEPYIHWWTFMGYYLAIGESSLATVLGIRSKIKKGKKLEKYEQEFRKNNPQYFNWDSRTIEEKEADAYIRELWNKEK